MYFTSDKNKEKLNSKKKFYDAFLNFKSENKLQNILIDENENKYILPKEIILMLNDIIFTIHDNEKATKGN